MKNQPVQDPCGTCVVPGQRQCSTGVASAWNKCSTSVPELGPTWAVRARTWTKVGGTGAHVREIADAEVP